MDVSSLSSFPKSADGADVGAPFKWHGIGGNHRTSEKDALEFISDCQSPARTHAPVTRYDVQRLWSYVSVPLLELARRNAAHQAELESPLEEHEPRARLEGRHAESKLGHCSRISKHVLETLWHGQECIHRRWIALRHVDDASRRGDYQGALHALPHVWHDRCDS